jgi:hypothetical protein
MLKLIFTFLLAMIASQEYALGATLSSAGNSSSNFHVQDIGSGPINLSMPI